MEVYTLRQRDLAKPFYTISVPKGEKEMVNNMTLAMNSGYRTQLQTLPAREFDRLFFGPWQFFGNERNVLLLDGDQVGNIKTIYHDLLVKNLLLADELETLRIAFSQLEHSYNLQSQQLLRLHARDETEAPTAREASGAGDLFRPPAPPQTTIPNIDYAPFKTKSHLL